MIRFWILSKRESLSSDMTRNWHYFAKMVRGGTTRTRHCQDLILVCIFLGYLVADSGHHHLQLFVFSAQWRHELDWRCPGACTGTIHPGRGKCLLARPNQTQYSQWLDFCHCIASHWVQPQPRLFCSAAVLLAVCYHHGWHQIAHKGHEWRSLHRRHSVCSFCYKLCAGRRHLWLGKHAATQDTVHHAGGRRGKSKVTEISERVS